MFVRNNAGWSNYEALRADRSQESYVTKFKAKLCWSHEFSSLFRQPDIRLINIKTPKESYSCITYYKSIDKMLF